ncbi:hypothetical protein ACFL5G_02330 [Candidatus Margulisiibacteriota bacterium]
MKLKSYLLLLIILLLTINGCSKNNLLQSLSKPGENEDPLEMAQRYLDEGKYSKAEYITRDLLGDNTYDNDEEAKVILGQALMGSAGLDLNKILLNLTDPPTSATSNFSLLNFIALEQRPKIFEAADYLLNSSSTEKPVRLSAGIAGLCAAVLKVNTTFNPSGGDVGSMTATPDIRPLWNIVSADVKYWSVGGLSSLAYATDDPDLRESASSVDAQIDDVNAAVAAGFPVPSSTFINLLGY